MSETDQKLYQMLRALDRRVGKLETLEQYIPPGGNFVPHSSFIPAWSGASPSATSSYATSWTMAALGLPAATKGLVVRAGARWAAASTNSFIAVSGNGSNAALICRATVANIDRDEQGIIPIVSGTLYAGAWGVAPVAGSVNLFIFGYFL